MAVSTVRNDLASLAQSQYSTWRQTGANAAAPTCRACRQSRDGDIATPQPARSEPVALGHAFAVENSTATLQHSAEVEITTAEGDRVKVGFNLKSAVSTANYQDDQVSAQSAQFQFNGNVMFSVEGNISEQERAAIHDLLTKVDTVASQFFHGDVNAAFGQALNLGFDGNTLAQFSVNLSASATQAVSAYQQTSSPTVAPIPDATRDTVKKLANDVAHVAKAPATTILADVHETLKQLFGAALSAHAEDSRANTFPPSQAIARNAHDLLATLLDKEKAQSADVNSIDKTNAVADENPASREGQVTVADKANHRQLNEQ